MDLAKLKTELALPAYAGLSDEAAADAMNRPDKQPDRDSVTSMELMGALDEGEYNSLVARSKTYWGLLLQAGGVAVTPIVKQQLAALFGQGTTTRANLLALLKRTGSRADELGLGRVTPSDVADAKRLQ